MTLSYHQKLINYLIAIDVTSSTHSSVDTVCPYLVKQQLTSRISKTIKKKINTLACKTTNIVNMGGINNEKRRVTSWDSWTAMSGSFRPTLHRRYLPEEQACAITVISVRAQTFPADCLHSKHLLLFVFVFFHLKPGAPLLRDSSAKWFNWVSEWVSEWGDLASLLRIISHWKRWERIK